MTAKKPSENGNAELKLTETIAAIRAETENEQRLRQALTECQVRGHRLIGSASTLAELAGYPDLNTAIEAMNEQADS